MASITETEGRGFLVSPTTFSAPTSTTSIGTVPGVDWHSRTMILLAEAYRWEKAQITGLVATSQLPSNYAALLLKDLRRIYGALAKEVRRCDETDVERQRVTSEHLAAMLVWSDSALCLEADPRHFDARIALNMGDCAVGGSGCLIPLTLAGMGYCAQRKLNNHRRRRVQVLMRANEALEEAKRQQDTGKVCVCEESSSTDVSQALSTSSWDSEENAISSECDSDEQLSDTSF